MATSKPLGYAVVGLGGIATGAVLPAFRHSRKAKLVVVVSGDRAKARRIAAKFGAARHYTYDEYDRCLADPDVQAVFLASVNGAHADQTIRAAEAGKHVLCEKPMANTAEDCRRMIDACQRNRVRLMIAYRKHFEPASLALKKLVAARKLGPLKLIHSAFTICLPAGAPPWHLNPALSGGGSLMDLGVYCVNTVRWLADRDPTEAEAYAWSGDAKRFRDAEESIAFRLKFPGGMVLQAASSFGAAQASFLHVHGERGWAALDPAFAYDEERRLFGKIGGRWFAKKFPRMDEFVLELDAFADAVRRGQDPEPDGIQGMRDVAVMEAIYRSAAARTPVVIDPAELAL